MNNKEKEAQLLNAMQAFDTVVASMQNRKLGDELKRRSDALQAFVKNPGPAYEAQRDAPVTSLPEIPGRRYIPTTGLTGWELKEADAFNWLMTTKGDEYAMTYLTNAMPVQTISNLWRFKWSSAQDTYDLQQYITKELGFKQAVVTEDGSTFYTNRFDPSSAIKLW